MARQNRIAPQPCQGVIGTLTEAALCRRCVRPEVPCDPDRTLFITPMARVDSSALGARLHCEYFVPRKEK